MAGQISGRPTFFTVMMLLFVLAPLNSLSQQKFERESRIRAEAAPQAARAFIRSMPQASRQKIRWYLEESLDGYSVEAKFKADKSCYSVEFDTLGALQDVEIQIPESALPAPVLQAVGRRLDGDFIAWKLLKVQRQYSGTPTNVLLRLAGKSDDAAVTEKYEIVLRGRNKDGTAWYEYTFSATGAFELRSEIVSKNADNLEF